MAKQRKVAQTDTIWILVDAPEGGDLAQYAGPLQIDVEKLGEHFASFTTAISKALAKCKPFGDGEYGLTEITFQAKLSAEVGFTLVGKGGIEGAVGFKFVKVASPGDEPKSSKAD